ncbi:MAG: UDP-N-acetylmuramoyl-tripeptide--D-alanyl-D-alanine ligase [Deltaproteobacteria bacterium]|nr:UDP-N-acetylmuramoyl-tripeptide--D-alanyl-D-alanine ligase [Deltaproteobacteria bacterium]
MELTVNEIVRATGGTLRDGEAAPMVSGISTDSRRVREREAFFALKGPNFDGHGFVRDVLAKGASCVVVERGFTPPPDACAVAVGDTLKALGDLASYWRGLHDIPVIAVSGSAGKTTTKDMIASILSVSRPVLKTAGNFNNLIGLPLTLFGLDRGHRAAVLELGISEPFEMERLVEICAPGAGVITNIGGAHLKTLGSIEGVAKAKSALFTNIGVDGTRVVNRDDQWVARLSAGLRNVVTYSLKHRADVMVKGCSVDRGLGHVDAVYRVRGVDMEARINGASAANVMNGAAAIASTLHLDVSGDEIREGLRAFTPASGRMSTVKIGALTVLDDTYNANPTSVAASLETLSTAKGRKVAILGDMLELGDASGPEHRKIGRLAGSLGADAIVAIGEWSRAICDGAVEAGLKSVHAFKDKREAIEGIEGLLREGDTVLVKGSRGMRLEEVVDAIRASWDAADGRSGGPRADAVKTVAKS